MINVNDVKYIAKLARLEFGEDELINFTHKFNEILKYVEKLNEVDTENVEATSHVVPITNVVRKDESLKRWSESKILEMAPESNDNFFIVPKVLS